MTIPSLLATLRRVLCQSAIGLMILAGIMLLPSSFTRAQEAAPDFSPDFSPAQKQQIEKLIRSYLLTHPEILKEAAEALEAKQTEAEATNRSKTLRENAGQIFSGQNSAVIGNPQGNVTVVEFFDYNCGYCRHMLPDLLKLAGEDKELRFILTDFPVLGPGSVETARVAFGVRKQLFSDGAKPEKTTGFAGEKFWQFHQQLLGTQGQVGKTQALSVAKALGLDMDKLAHDSSTSEVSSSLSQTMQIADGLNLTGTPSFIIGPDVVVGAMSYQELKGKIENVRKCGHIACS